MERGMLRFLWDAGSPSLPRWSPWEQNQTPHCALSTFLLSQRISIFILTVTWHDIFQFSVSMGLYHHLFYRLKKKTSEIQTHWILILRSIMANNGKVWILCKSNAACEDKKHNTLVSTLWLPLGRWALGRSLVLSHFVSRIPNREVFTSYEYTQWLNMILSIEPEDEVWCILIL